MLSNDGKREDKYKLLVVYIVGGDEVKRRRYREIVRRPYKPLEMALQNTTIDDVEKTLKIAI